MDHLVGNCTFGGCFRSSFCRRAAVKKHKNYRILLGNSGHSWETLGNHEIGPKSTQNSLFRCFRGFCVLCKGIVPCGAIFVKFGSRRVDFQVFRGLQLVHRGLYPDRFWSSWTRFGSSLDEIWTRSELPAQIPELWRSSQLSSGSDP